MKVARLLFGLFIGLCMVSVVYGASDKASGKKRLLVVDSYHSDYNWSRDTHEGFCAAMFKMGYFDNKNQIAEYTKNDYVETSKVIVKKLWMDSKKKSGKAEKEQESIKIYRIAKEFKPHLMFLGDDNAARYIGKKFLDTEIPIVFWGINNTPLKYGLVDSIEEPGHNVTGVYQSGYYIENFGFLKALVPSIKTFAILSDDSTTGRSISKAVQYLDHKQALPLKLVEVVSMDNYELWKKKVLELQGEVDAFYIAQYNALKDQTGAYVKNVKVAQWYLENVKIPEAAPAGQFVKQGILCAADDSGYNQGYEAVAIAHDILANGADPSKYPPRSPKRGALMVNKKRAKMLGITFTDDMGIEEYVE